MTYHLSPSIGQKETQYISQCEEAEKCSAPKYSGRRDQLDMGTSRSPLYSVFFIQNNKENMNKTMFYSYG